MLKGVEIRLYPNRKQQKQLRQMFGNTRFVWNTMLGMINERYRNNPSFSVPHKYALDLLLPLLKEEYPFLKESDATALQKTNANLYQSWHNFFKNPKHFGKPNFKSQRYPKQSYTGNSKIQVTGRRYLKIPKLGFIKTSKVAFLTGMTIKQYTLSLEPSGRYKLSLQVEDGKKTPKTVSVQKAVGIDLGVSDLAILSTGDKFAKFSSAYDESQVIEWQKKYSKRKHQAKVQVAMDKNKKVLIPRELEDFNGWQKAQKIKACYQEKLANKRKDYLHRITTQLVKDYDVLVIEDLKAKNMMKNHHLAKSIANSAWYLFRSMLEYKCQWYGKQLIVVPSHYTSQECSHCHFNSGKKDLSIREWNCPKCGTHHDRDVNAAQNILSRGLATLTQVKQ